MLRNSRSLPLAFFLCIFFILFFSSCYRFLTQQGLKAKHEKKKNASRFSLPRRAARVLSSVPFSFNSINRRMKGKEKEGTFEDASWFSSLVRYIYVYKCQQIWLRGKANWRWYSNKDPSSTIRLDTLLHANSFLLCSSVELPFLSFFVFAPTTALLYSKQEVKTNQLNNNLMDE